jgi:hypothetical protein
MTKKDQQRGIDYTSRKFDPIAAKIQQGQLIQCDFFHSMQHEVEREAWSFGQIKRGAPT